MPCDNMWHPMTALTCILALSFCVTGTLTACDALWQHVTPYDSTNLYTGIKFLCDGHFDSMWRHNLFRKYLLCENNLHPCQGIRFHCTLKYRQRLFIIHLAVTLTLLIMGRSQSGKYATLVGLQSFSELIKTSTSITILYAIPRLKRNIFSS